MYNYLNTNKHPSDRNRNILQSIIPNTQHLSCLEIGVGNSLSSIPLSEIFQSYTGIEPDYKLFQLSKENCQLYSCKIQLVNQSFTDFHPETIYDMIIMINVSFLLKYSEFESYLYKMLNMLSKNGIIYIQNPSIHSNRWGDSRLNKNNPEYNKELRRNRQKRLKENRKMIKKFCQDNSLDYTRHKINDVCVYVLKNQ
jgi:predicted O-methyltransferase YrrM